MPVKFEWQTDQEHEWTEEQAVTPGEMLRLVAPGSRYERPLFHGIDSCGTAVWVNRP